jgi:hypothetical protein
MPIIGEVVTVVVMVVFHPGITHTHRGTKKGRAASPAFCSLRSCQQVGE